jgi:hypothetical protein
VTDAEVMRHVRALGLGSLDGYRAWCREHGFRADTRKSWQEQREERRVAEKAISDAAARAELLRHATTLGFWSLEEYGEWCRRRGFRDGPNKSREQQRQERLAAAREKAEAALTGRKSRSRRPEETLHAVYRGEIEVAELGPALQGIHHAFDAARDAPGVPEALLALLLHAQEHSRLIATEPVVGSLGRQEGNSLIEGLLALARRHSDWLRPVAEWRPDTHNARRQFGSLARHLLTCYPVPDFMDAAWFEGDTPLARRHQDWFLQIGLGYNIRAAGVPLHLTKRMAHEFLEAPGDLPIGAALRYGQVLGLGGDERLARAVIATRLGEMTEDEPFWLTVLHFFVNNPMLDAACIGPIVDYVRHRRTEPEEAAALPTYDHRPPTTDHPAPGTGHRALGTEFSMKGRTVAALLRLVEEWHAELARETRRRPVEWEASGIGEFHLLDEAGESPRCWTIHEVCTDKELKEEGREQKHCVASYARSCARGQTSVWSMQVEERRTGARRRVMTIAVQNAHRKITEARGRCNKLPSDRHASQRLEEAPAILRQWARQEGLVLPSYVL